MRGAMGNALLLNVIIVIVSVVMLFFVSILTYSKAYRAKNRIVEVIEKHGEYNDDARDEIITSLTEMGYQNGSCNISTAENADANEFKYCVEKKYNNPDCLGSDCAYYYKVTTYVEFYFPVIGKFFHPAVTSETKILNKKYNY